MSIIPQNFYARRCIIIFHFTFVNYSKVAILSREQILRNLELGRAKNKYTILRMFVPSLITALAVGCLNPCCRLITLVYDPSPPPPLLTYWMYHQMRRVSLRRRREVNWLNVAHPSSEEGRIGEFDVSALVLSCSLE